MAQPVVQDLGILSSATSGSPFYTAGWSGGYGTKSVLITSSGVNTAQLELSMDGATWSGYYAWFLASGGGLVRSLAAPVTDTFVVASAVTFVRFTLSAWTSGTAHMWLIGTLG